MRTLFLAFWLVTYCLSGCPEVAASNLIIGKPVVNFSFSPTCEHSETLFYDRSEVSRGKIIEWFWDFGDGNGNSDLPNPGYTYNKAGIYTVSLTITSDEGQKSTATRKLQIFERPSVPIPYHTAVCYEREALLKVETSGQQVYWYKNETDDESVFEGNEFKTMPLRKSVIYYASVRNEAGCFSDRVSVRADVYAPLEAQIHAIPAELTLPVGEAAFGVKTSRSVVDWKWNFGDGDYSKASSPKHEYQQPGKYKVWLTLTDDNGCKWAVSKYITVNRESGITIPSAFSPNGDGVNDYFKIDYYQLKAFRIEISDRSGAVVFHSEDPNFSWDGNDLKGTGLPEGEYALYIEAEDLQGKPISEKRSLIMIK